MSTLKSSELTSLVNKVLKEVGRLRKGNNLTYHCPKCHHRKRKLEVCLDEPYKFHCWTCDLKGRGLYGLFKVANADQSSFSILEKLVGTRQQTHDTEILFKDKIIMGLRDKTPVRAETHHLPYDFRSLLENDGSIEYKMAANYAKKRRLTHCDIVKHNIGYCVKGPFQNRLVIPSYDKDNNLNFYSCRSYYEDGYKYKNAEFNKNIIGFENLVDFDYPIYLCEGAFDAIALRRNAIPLFGKTLSQKLKSAINQSKCPEVNVVLDDDALGSAIRIAQWLHSIGKIVKLVKLQGKDPSVLGFAKSLEQVKKTEELDFFGLTKLRLE
jgi:hypothetical protein